MPKKPHPVLVSMAAAQARVAEKLAAQIEADSETAMRALRQVAEHGDLNGTRTQAAIAILKIAGQMDQARSTSIKASTEGDGGKITVEVVHLEKPPAEDDD